MVRTRRRRPSVWTTAAPFSPAAKRRAPAPRYSASASAEGNLGAPDSPGRNL